MKRVILCLLAFVAISFSTLSQTIDERLPVRGLAIGAPSHSRVDAFVSFIEKELAPSKVNLIILRVDWGYEFTSHPELRDGNPLTAKDVEMLVSVCKKHGIKLVPHINLLGHQSWAAKTNALLRAYPEFDETPSVKTENYTGWPNPDRLYCKSYCPLHPDVHKVVFDVIDELCDVFQSDSFHAGMDEVFYIGEDECPRCHGKDKSELYAGEINAIHDHLAGKGRSMMIWGDRLLDGRTTGLGEWEASYNDTWRAIDMIPKDVLVCDWHYSRADLSCVYFAMKGLPVVSCGWNNPEMSVRQVKDMLTFRSQTTSKTAGNLKGYVHTIWSGSDTFVDSFYREAGPDGKRDGQVDATKAVLKAFREIE